jgi:hypothetical protein
VSNWIGGPPLGPDLHDELAHRRRVGVAKGRIDSGHHHLEEGLFDERFDHDIDGRSAVDLVKVDDLTRSLEGETAMKDHRLGERGSLPGLQQIERPGDDAGEGRAPGSRGAGRMSRQTLDELVGRQDATACGSDLDRLWHPVEVTSDGVDRGELNRIGSTSVATTGLVGALNEQSRRLAHVTRPPLPLQRQRTDRDGNHVVLLRNRRTLCDEKMRPRAEGRKRGQHRDGIFDVVDAIDDDQAWSALGEDTGHAAALGRIAGRGIWQQAKHQADEPNQAGAVVDAQALDEPDAALDTDPRQLAGGRAQGQASLADPGRTTQNDDGGWLGQELGEAQQRPLAADESAALDGKIGAWRGSS